jgi:hypothetical protein
MARTTVTRHRQRFANSFGVRDCSSILALALCRRVASCPQGSAIQHAERGALAVYLVKALADSGSVETADNGNRVNRGRIRRVHTKRVQPRFWEMQFGYLARSFFRQ